MKKYSATYQTIFKAVTLFLLMAILIPTGLQAKQLVDFCNMEMNSHMTDMSSSHDCSDSEPKENSHHQNHDCDYGAICACTAQNHIGEENYLPTIRDAAVKPDVKVSLTPFFTTSEPIRQDLQKRIGQHDSPLYLLYDTFLM